MGTPVTHQLKATPATKSFERNYFVEDISFRFQMYRFGIISVLYYSNFNRIRLKFPPDEYITYLSV